MLFLIASDFTFTTRHIHNWAFFLLWSILFILSGAISPFFFISIFNTYLPGQFIFQCHDFFLFMLFMGFSRQKCCSGLPTTLSMITSRSMFLQMALILSFLWLSNIPVCTYVCVHVHVCVFHIFTHPFICQ